MSRAWIWPLKPESAIGDNEYVAAMVPPGMLKMLLPLACAWAEEQERLILEAGVALTAPQLAAARRIGVKECERVRLRVVQEMPMPENPVLRAAADMTGMLSPDTVGLTLRYGILIRADHWGEWRLVVHELAHTAQYERLGGFHGFLSAYLDECLMSGYPAGPLEQEARRIEREMEERRAQEGGAD
jgi:hypothetical protein